MAVAIHWAEGVSRIGENRIVGSTTIALGMVDANCGNVPSTSCGIWWGSPPDRGRTTVANDWGRVLTDLERGEPSAVLAVTRVITGLLVRARAYDLRDSWEDLCQDVLLALITTHREGRLRETDAFVSYVGAITRNKLADWLAANRRGNGALLSLEGRPDPIARIRDEDMLIDVERALALLSSRERRVIEVLYLEGHSYEKGAELLGMPLGTLKRLQTGALRFIRKQLLLETRRVESPVTRRSSAPSIQD